MTFKTVGKIVALLLVCLFDKTIILGDLCQNNNINLAVQFTLFVIGLFIYIAYIFGILTVIIDYLKYMAI